MESNLVKILEFIGKEINIYFGISKPNGQLYRTPLLFSTWLVFKPCHLYVCGFHNIIIDDEGLELENECLEGPRIHASKDLTYIKLYEDTITLENQNIQIELQNDHLVHLWRLKGLPMHELSIELVFLELNMNFTLLKFRK